MKRLLLLLLLTLGGREFVQAQYEVENAVIFFDANSPELSDEATSQLNRIYQKIERASEYQIWFSGYADSLEHEKVGVQLAEDRLDVVYGYLLDKGLSDENVHKQSYDSDHGFASNDTEEGRARNRRVSITVDLHYKRTGGNNPWLQAWLKADDNSKVFADIKTTKDLYKLMMPKDEVFVLDLSQDTSLQAPQGTIIDIPAGAFVVEGDSAPEGDVEIKIREVYRKSDMIRADLITTSDRYFLETAGMVHIEATSYGTKLKIRRGKQIKVHFPFTVPQADMQIFYGYRDDKGDIDWMLPDGRARRLPQVPKLDPKDKKKKKKVKDMQELVAKREEMKRRALGLLGKESHYVLKVKEVGWINCDRYFDVPQEEKRDFYVVKQDTASDEEIKLVFREHAVILKGEDTGDGKVVFRGIPKDIDVDIVGLKYENETPYIAVHNAIIEEAPFQGLNYVKTSPDKWDEYISKVDD